MKAVPVLLLMASVVAVACGDGDATTAPDPCRTPVHFQQLTTPPAAEAIVTEAAGVRATVTAACDSAGAEAEPALTFTSAFQTCVAGFADAALAHLPTPVAIPCNEHGVDPEGVETYIAGLPTVPPLTATAEAEICAADLRTVTPEPSGEHDLVVCLRALTPGP